MLDTTIIIPCYNHERWIRESIESVLAQTYPCKLIVVDNGSTDKSYEIAQTYMNGLNVDVCKAVEKQGPSYARNFGIKMAMARGAKFIGFLDSDDIYHKTKVEKSVAVMEDENIGLVYSDYDRFNEDTGFLGRDWKQPFSRERLLSECIINNDSVLRAKVFEACGTYDEEMRVCEDYDLWMRISEQFMVYHIPEALVTVRIGPHSSTDNVAKARWEKDYKRVFQKVQQRMSCG